MKLRFETQPELTDGFELPMLVDVNNIRINEPIEALTIDDQEVTLDDAITQTIAQTVAHINREELPEGHFRDCVSFTIGMCGIWLPTHRPFDGSFNFTQTCDEQPSPGVSLTGPVSSGIPKGETHLGFEGINYIYSHMAFGLDTSRGNLFVFKSGVEAEYFMSTLQAMLDWYEHTVVHPVTEVHVSHRTKGELVSVQF